MPSKPRFHVGWVVFFLAITPILAGCIKQGEFDDVRLRGLKPELVFPITQDVAWPNDRINGNSYTYDAQGTLCAYHALPIALPANLLTAEQMPIALEGLAVACTTPLPGGGFYGGIPFSGELVSIELSSAQITVRPQNPSFSGAITVAGLSLRSGAGSYENIVLRFSTEDNASAGGVRLTASEPCTVVFVSYSEAIFSVKGTGATSFGSFTISDLSLQFDFFNDNLLSDLLIDRAELRVAIHRKGLLRRVPFNVALNNTIAICSRVPADYQGLESKEVLMLPLSSKTSVNDPEMLAFNSSGASDGAVIYSRVPATDQDSVTLRAVDANSNLTEVMRYGPTAIRVGQILFAPAAQEGDAEGVTAIYSRGSSFTPQESAFLINISLLMPLHGKINQLLWESVSEVSLPKDLSVDAYMLTNDDTVTIYLQFINSLPVRAHCRVELLPAGGRAEGVYAFNFGDFYPLRSLNPYFTEDSDQALFIACEAAKTSGTDAVEATHSTISMPLDYGTYKLIVQQAARLRVLYSLQSPDGKRVRVKKGDELSVRLGLEIHPELSRISF